MSEILDLIFGPIGGAVAVLATALVSWLVGRSNGINTVERKLDKAYRAERKEIDHEDLGLGATDAQRAGRLRDIADKR